jgi:hypothetical protein
VSFSVFQDGRWAAAWCPAALAHKIGYIVELFCNWW